MRKNKHIPQFQSFGPPTPPLDGIPSSELKCAASTIQLWSTFTGPAIEVYRASDTTYHDVSFDVNGDILDSVLTTIGSDLKLSKLYSQFVGGLDITQTTVADMLDIVVGGVVQRNDSGILGGLKPSSNSGAHMDVDSHTCTIDYCAISMYSYNGADTGTGTNREGSGGLGTNEFLNFIYGSTCYQKTINSSTTQRGHASHVAGDCANGAIMYIRHEVGVEYETRHNKNTPIISTPLTTDTRTATTVTLEVCKKLSGTTDDYHYHGEILFDDATDREDVFNKIIKKFNI